MKSAFRRPIGFAFANEDETSRRNPVTSSLSSATQLTRASRSRSGCCATTLPSKWWQHLKGVPDLICQPSTGCLLSTWSLLILKVLRKADKTAFTPFCENMHCQVGASYKRKPVTVFTTTHVSPHVHVSKPTCPTSSKGSTRTALSLVPSCTQSFSRYPRSAQDCRYGE